MTNDERAALLILEAVAHTIREVSPVPAGILYARLMDQISLETFERIVASLVAAKLVRRAGNHELHWIGPKPVVN